MPVIVNLQASEKDLARRMIDFCSGLTYAVGGSMEKVAESVFLLTPSNVEVSHLFLFGLVIRVVLSYIPAPPGSALVPITRFFDAITEPVLRPVRRIVPPVVGATI